MKKYFLIPLLFLACTQPNIDNKLKEVEIENKIIKNYQISKDALTKVDDSYIFFMPEVNGLGIYKLDKNYNLTQKSLIKGLIQGHKLLYKNNKLYLLGYDEEKNRPVILILNKNLKVLNYQYIGNKFDIPRDFYIQDHPVVLLTTYKNGAKIEIIDKEPLIIESKNNALAKIIKPFNGGILVAGSIQQPQEDLLLIFIKDNKVVWSKTYDFGMEDLPTKVEIKNDKAKIYVKSEDYMGAEKNYIITIDKDGNIIDKVKGIEIKQLPMKFRT